MPNDRQLYLSEDGVISARETAWEGPYQPDISCVLRDTLASGHLAGAILFSGMGDDGAAVAQDLVRQGVPLWCQTPETCASPAMVEAARATGAVQVLDDPEGLARRVTMLTACQRDQE